jgi:hypothetical protein
MSSFTKTLTRIQNQTTQCPLRHCKEKAYGALNGYRSIKLTAQYHSIKWLNTIEPFYTGVCLINKHIVY